MPELTTPAQINTYLDGNKLVVDATTDNPYQEQAAVIIKGRLWGIIDPVLITAWDILDPTKAPPVLIQQIAAKLSAALLYRKTYSEDVPDRVTPYGQALYNEALSELESVALGYIKLYDLPVGSTAVTDEGLTSGMFYPDNNAAILDKANDKKFRMSDRF